MPPQTYDALLRALAKGELAPVYYLHGPEDILKDEAVEAILDRALEPGLRDFNLDQLMAFAVSGGYFTIKKMTVDEGRCHTTPM